MHYLFQSPSCAGTRSVTRWEGETRLHRQYERDTFPTLQPFYLFFSFHRSHVSATYWGHHRIPLFPCHWIPLRRTHPVSPISQIVACIPHCPCYGLLYHHRSPPLLSVQPFSPVRSSHLIFPAPVLDQATSSRFHCRRQHQVIYFVTFTLMKPN